MRREAALPPQPEVRVRPHDPALMSAADAAWLRMDRPDNHMVVTALLVTAAPLTRARTLELLDRTFALHPRFRRPLRRHRWEPAPRLPFELESHLHVAPFDGPPTEDELRTFIGSLMAEPLDLTRPAWEVFLVEHYGPGSALVLRLHHALADGIALMRVLLASIDKPAQMRPVSMPMHGRGSLKGLKLAGGVVSSLARLVFLPKDRRSSLKGALSGVKHVAWSEPIPLERIKRAGAPDQATINDVLTSALAGALARYFRAHPGSRAPKAIRALVPYDLRAGRADERLGNHFGLLFLPLPTAPMPVRERLRQVKRRIDHLKQTPEAWVAYGLVEVIGRLSSLLASLAIWLFGRKGSVVLTNVAGPRERVSISGVEVQDLLFWVPQAGGIGVGFSFFSYAGSVRLGVAADERLIRDPTEIAEGFTAELRALEDGGA